MAAWSRFLAAAAAKVRSRSKRSAPVAPQPGNSPAAAASGECFPSTGAAAGGPRRRFVYLIEKLRGGKPSPAPKDSAAAAGAKAAPKDPAEAAGAKVAVKASAGDKAVEPRRAAGAKASEAARRSVSTDARAPQLSSARRSASSTPPPPETRSNEWYRLYSLGAGATAFIYQMLRIDMDKEVDRKIKEKELKEKENLVSQMEMVLEQKDEEIKTLQQSSKARNWWFF